MPYNYKGYDYVIGVAEKEVGYKEHKTNSEINSKTENQGNGGCTKYAAEIDEKASSLLDKKINGYSDRDWGFPFIIWCFLIAFEDISSTCKALYLEKKGEWYNLEAVVENFASKGATTTDINDVKVGDIVFWKHHNSKNHLCGIITEIDRKARLFTYIGKDSVAGINQVTKSTKKFNDRQITGYGKVDYSAVSLKPIESGTSASTANYNTNAGEYKGERYEGNTTTRNRIIKFINTLAKRKNIIADYVKTKNPDWIKYWNDGHYLVPFYIGLAASCYVENKLKENFDGEWDVDGYSFGIFQVHDYRYNGAYVFTSQTVKEYCGRINADYNSYDGQIAYALTMATAENGSSPEPWTTVRNAEYGHPDAETTGYALAYTWRGEGGGQFGDSKKFPKSKQNLYTLGSKWSQSELAQAWAYYYGAQVSRGEAKSSVWKETCAREIWEDFSTNVGLPTADGFVGLAYDSTSVNVDPLIQKVIHNAFVDYNAKRAGRNLCLSWICNWIRGIAGIDGLSQGPYEETGITTGFAGYSCPNEIFNAYQKEGWIHTTGTPPAGAVTFYTSASMSAYGHIALSLGGDKVITPWTSEMAITSVTGGNGSNATYRGWAYPNNTPIGGWTNTGYVDTETKTVTADGTLSYTEGNKQQEVAYEDKDPKFVNDYGNYFPVRQFKREFRLNAKNAEGDAFAIGKRNEHGIAPHISFSVQQLSTGAITTANITLWNLTAEQLHILWGTDCQIWLRAGYDDRLPLIFTGYVLEMHVGMDGANRSVSLTCQAECTKLVRKTEVKLSYADKVSVYNLLVETVRQLGATYCFTERAAKATQNTVFSTGYSYANNAENALTELCKSAEIDFAYDAGIVYFKCSDEAATQVIHNLSRKSGLIDMPTEKFLQNTYTAENSHTNKVRYNMSGYTVKYLMNGAIHATDMIRLESQKNSKGYYEKGYAYKQVFRIYSISFNGDNLSGEWSCTAELWQTWKAIGTISGDYNMMYL